MLGTSLMLSERASRSKRARRSGSLANESERILIATARSSFVSRAPYTSPIPPAPTIEITSYGPILVPGASLIFKPLAEIIRPGVRPAAELAINPYAPSSPAPATSQLPPRRVGGSETSIELGCGCGPNLSATRSSCRMRNAV